MRAIGVCTIEQQHYLLRDRPESWNICTRLSDSEVIFRTTKATYVLLLELLQMLVIMHGNGKIAHGSIVPENIILLRSSMLEFPAFWLIGLTTSTHSVEALGAAQTQDVRMALHLAESASKDRYGLNDPIVGPLLLKLCSNAESRELSALEAFTAFDSALSAAAVPSPFQSVRFQKTFRLKVVDRIDFVKRELAALVRAYFVGNPTSMLEAHKAIMQVKPAKTSPHQEKPADYARISIKDAQTVFNRLGLDEEEIFDPDRFQANLKRTVSVDFNVSFHKPSATWNITHVLPIIMPADSWRSLNPEHFLDVRGSPALQGLFVDSKTFASACNALKVSRAHNLHVADTQTQKMARLARGDVLLVDQQLLRNTVIFRRSSNSIHFGPSAEYTTDQVLRICDDFHLADLCRGIESLHCHPPSIDALIHDWLAEDDTYDCQSLTVSLFSVGETADGVIKAKEKEVSPLAAEEMTHEWVEEQGKRRRGSDMTSVADIQPTNFIRGSCLRRIRGKFKRVA